MRQIDYRSMWHSHSRWPPVCNAELDSNEPLALSRVSPLAMSSPKVWRLFDRSIDSQFAPGDHQRRSPSIVRAIGRLRSTARRHTGSTSVVAAAARSARSPRPVALPRGWHVIAASAPVTTDQGRAPVRATTAGSPDRARARAVATGRRPGAQRRSDAQNLRPGSPRSRRVATAIRSPRRLHGACRRYRAITPARCARIPGLRRHGLSARSSRAFDQRPGRARWRMAGERRRCPHGGRRDRPGCSGLGSNVSRLCSPATATGDITISMLRIIGELEYRPGTGDRRHARDARRDGSAVLDGGRPQQRWSWRAASGSRSRRPLIAPDALVLSGTVAADLRSTVSIGRHATSGAGTAYVRRRPASCS